MMRRYSLRWSGAAKQLLWGNALSLQRASYSLTLPLAGHGGRRPKGHARLIRGGNALPRKSKWSPDGTIEGVLRVDGLSIDSTVQQLCEAFCIDISPSAIQSMPQHELLLRYRFEPINFIFASMIEDHRQQFAKVFGSSEVYIKLEAMSVLRASGIVTLSDWSNLSEFNRDSIVKRVEEHSMVRNLLDQAARDAGLSLETGLVRKADTTLLYDAIVSATCNSYSVAMDEDPQGYIVAYGDPNDWVNVRESVAEGESTYGVSNAGPIPVGSKWRDEKKEALRVLSISPGHGVGWPIEWTETELYVRKETLVATKTMFSTEHIDGKDVAMLLHRHSIIIGTPGIGKSFMSGFFLHKLLTEDVIIPINFLSEKSEPRQQHTKLRYILYSIRGAFTIYDKVSKTTTVYRFYSEAADFYCCHKNETIHLFDCASGYSAPRPDYTPTMVFSSPDVKQFKDYEKEQSTCTHIVNPWTEEELCAWSHLEGLKWPVIKKRAEFVGNVPRLLSTRKYDQSLVEIHRAFHGVQLQNLFRYTLMNAPEYHPSHKTMVLIRSEKRVSECWNECASKYIESQLHMWISGINERERMAWCQNILTSAPMEGYPWEVAFLEACTGAPKFLLKVMETSVLIAGSINPLLSIYNDHKNLDKLFPIRREWVPLQGHVGNLEEGVLYIPEDKAFPVIDAFILLGDVLICFQATVSDKHSTNYGALDTFKACHFDRWGQNKNDDIKKVLVCFQPQKAPLSGPMTIHNTGRQVTSASKAELNSFWDKFIQYQCIVGDAFKESSLFLTKEEIISLLRAKSP